MVADVFDFLSLTPDEARMVGTVALVVLYLLDVFASADDVPGNTPREWIIRLTQWKSLWFWNPANRQQAKANGECKFWLVLFQYLPMTGALVPFFLAALVGHFFHPWSEPPLELGWWGLISVAIISIVISVATFFMSSAKRRHGENLVVWIAVLGLVAGVFLWPVT